MKGQLLEIEDVDRLVSAGSTGEKYAVDQVFTHEAVETSAGTLINECLKAVFEQGVEPMVAVRAVVIAGMDIGVRAANEFYGHPQIE
jgi:hypothetical protein